MEIYTYNYLTISTVALGLIAVVYVLTRTSVGQTYIKEHLPLHVRGVGMASIISTLVYASFFVDISNLRSEAAVKKASLENDVVFLGDNLPGIDEDYIRVSKQYGEIKGLLDTEENNKKLVVYLSESESDAQRLKSKLSSIQYRLGIARSSFLIPNEEKNESDDTVSSRLANLSKSIDSIEEIKKRVEREYAKKKSELNVITSELDSLKKSNYTENIFFAMRALSLGALGALVTLIATNIIGIQRSQGSSRLFVLPNYWSLLISHAFLGAVVSVVIFGLFYTKQLTIFQPENSSTGNGSPPEFWRVTMLCILAGAFAEKLYSAASVKVDRYVDEDEKKGI
ncbi:MAG: hypothetical protein JAY74_00170 [Candidatus Thiodiazotropha taylori]|nr:hypothetical protein [Candidatus Thiodiazotropha taylori]